mmetsp:Transcript_817/g.3077  ORF Transcript_817/g.3077 Transcript_817/m.3077 type:complete len:100 (-) Transcript_817:101-400(-)
MESTSSVAYVEKSTQCFKADARAGLIKHAEGGPLVSPGHANKALNAVASLNMSVVSEPIGTIQVRISDANALAPSNMLDMFCALEVNHMEMFWLNDDAP